jgi:hypothetical protein
MSVGLESDMLKDLAELTATVNPAPTSDAAPPLPPAAVAQPTPPAEPVAAAPASPPTPPAAPAPPAPPTVLDRLRGYGIEGDFENEDKALEHLASEAKRAQSQQSWANLGLQFAELQRSQDWQEFVASRRQPQQPVTPPVAAPSGSGAAPAGFQWQAPEFNPAWLNLVKYDDDGNLVPLPGADPLLPQKILAWRDFTQQQQTSLFQNPVQFFDPIVEQKLTPFKAQIEQYVQQQIAAVMAQNQVATFTDQALAEVEPWAWVRGNDGRRFIDPNTGRPVLTAEGLAYREALGELEALPPQKRHEYALRAVGRGGSSPSAPAAAPAAVQPQPNQPAAPVAPTPPPPPPTPAQLNAELKEQFTSRIPPGGGYNPPRAGSFSGGSGSLSPGAQDDNVVDETNLEQMMMAELNFAGAK